MGAALGLGIAIALARGFWDAALDGFGEGIAEGLGGSVIAIVGAEIHTLRDALRTWRMRVILLGIGVIALALPMTGMTVLVWIALTSAV